MPAMFITIREGFPVLFHAVVVDSSKTEVKSSHFTAGTENLSPILIADLEETI